MVIVTDDNDETGCDLRDDDKNDGTDDTDDDGYVNSDDAKNDGTDADDEDASAKVGQR